jgi:hypothetical protein
MSDDIAAHLHLPPKREKFNSIIYEKPVIISHREYQIGLL